MDTVISIAGRVSKNDPRFKKWIQVLDAYRVAAGFKSDRALCVAVVPKISEDYLSKLRKRKNIPHDDFLTRLANALGVEVDAIRPGAPFPAPSELPVAPQKRRRPEPQTLDNQALRQAVRSAVNLYCGRAGLSEDDIAEMVAHVAAVYVHLQETPLAKTA